ncbi:ornithine decarboxylase [bacterium]|nr:ornithine decarboxylase [bacterium]
MFDLESKRLNLWKVLNNESNQEEPSAKKIKNALDTLAPIETLWAYPGPEVLSKLTTYYMSGSWALFRDIAENTYTSIKTNNYRYRPFYPFKTNLMILEQQRLNEDNILESETDKPKDKPYFEVLVIHPSPVEYRGLYYQSLATFKTDRDEFVYDITFVDNAKDAITAILANPSIQTCVFINGFGIESTLNTDWVNDYQKLIQDDTYLNTIKESPLTGLSTTMKDLRPELDHLLISELAPHEVSTEMRTQFDRILFHINPFQDLHHSILNGIRERYSTPFFNALQAYSRKPKGVFHALPLSRGKSIIDSHWIKDMLEFYGPSIFLAETSSTQGGLDSLLSPKGTIKQSHEKVAKTFGSQRSFFVTNGTSTSNKIVMQSTLVPGDIVLISADCHKSIPYSVMLSGALPVFLETYPLPEYDLYGAVTLERIKEIMFDLKKNGSLHKLKQITLTNSTFDGLIYNVETYMMEILAIKPDIIFHWDEAWFAFSHFNPVYHHRTAMTVAKLLEKRFKSDDYKHEFSKSKPGTLPDPEHVILRVFATQSTHKTLTSFRQGSMIHIYDNAFDEDLFLEAFRTHTSTSPNYQIIASLDISRRQASLEGYERVKKAIQLAHSLKNKITSSKRISAYFKVLADEELIPKKYRSITQKSTSIAYTNFISNWGTSQFVVDPTRVTVDISKTGMDGSSFRQLLINKYDIQVNKTSRKTVLFIVNIGATEKSINYLARILEEISERLTSAPKKQNKLITEDDQFVDLPQKRLFFKGFVPIKTDTCDIPDLRKAFFAAYDKQIIDYVPLTNETIKDVLNDKKIISASFVTPYPPGFPVLVPGQIITYDILLYLQRMKIKEVHGYQPELGLKIFKQDYLDKLV